MEDLKKLAEKLNVETGQDLSERIGQVRLTYVEIASYSGKKIEGDTILSYYPRNLTITHDGHEYTLSEEKSLSSFRMRVPTHGVWEKDERGIFTDNCNRRLRIENLS